MKKFVPKTRSMNCSIAAACSGGKARSSRNDVTSCVQTKNGRRDQVSPGARNCTIVTMKFTAPKSDEKIRNSMPQSQTVWPIVAMFASGT